MSASREQNKIEAADSQGEWSAAVMEEKVPVWKVWLKKYRFSLLLIVGLVFLLCLLLWLKSKMLMHEGQSTGFSTPHAPDIAEQNQKQQKAQGEKDRYNDIKARLGQSDALTNTSLSTEPMNKPYEMAQVYEQKATAVSSSVSQNVAKPNEPVQVSQVEQKMEGHSERSSKRVVYVMANKQKVPPFSSQLREDRESGFNTVVLQHPVTAHPENPSTKPKSDYIKAAVYGSQTIRSGSAVRVRLLEAATIDGIEIPANSICMGIAMLGANRVSIALTSVQVRGQQLGIKKVVCDKDLIPGIAFVNENALEQNARQQRNASIDQTTNTVMSNIPYGTGVAGVAVATGTGIVRGVSQGLRYGGIQKRAGEIQLEEGYKVFIIN